MKTAPVLEFRGELLSLTEIEAHCWNQLKAGLHYKHALHHPVIANGNEQGVNMRVVVLRYVDEVQKNVGCHTDTRSGKWSELQVDPALSWLFYDRDQRQQIRLYGTASLHQFDDTAEAAWEKSPLHCRRIYMGNDAPSTEVDYPSNGLPQALKERNPTTEESREGRPRFGIIRCQIHRMEWLWLHHEGHRRAGFDYREDGSFVSSWLVP